MAVPQFSVATSQGTEKNPTQHNDTNAHTCRIESCLRIHMDSSWHLGALRRLHAFSCDWKLHKFFFPETLQELIFHLNAGYCAWKYIDM